MLFVLERSNVLRAVLQGYTGTAENRFHFPSVFSKAPEPEGGYRMSQAAVSALSHVDRTRWQRSTRQKQRTADVNCIRTCPPFTSKLLVLPPPNVRRRALQWKRRGNKVWEPLRCGETNLLGDFVFWHWWNVNSVEFCSDGVAPRGTMRKTTEARATKKKKSQDILNICSMS